MTKVINLTPHKVDILQSTNNTANPGPQNWRVSKSFEKSENPARVKIHEIPRVSKVDGIAISETFASTNVENLPEPEAGVYYIVSRQVMEAKPERDDLLIVNGSVRDDNGKIIGVTGFARVVKPKEWVATDAPEVYHIDEYDKTNPDHGFPIGYFTTKEEAEANLVMPE
jgi:hypothetical protein